MCTRRATLVMPTAITAVARGFAAKRGVGQDNVHADLCGGAPPPLGTMVGTHAPLRVVGLGLGLRLGLLMRRCLVRVIKTPRLLVHARAADASIP